MLKVGDRVKVKYGKFEGCVGTIRSINHDYLPPVVIMPDDIKKYQGVYFYEDDLEKIEEKEMIKMTIVEKFLNTELTAEEIDQLLVELTKRKQTLFEERRKQAFINFEKAFDKLMEVSPTETIYIDFNNAEGVSYTVDILNVFENYFKNMSTEYDME